MLLHRLDLETSANIRRHFADLPRKSFFSKLCVFFPLNFDDNLSAFPGNLEIDTASMHLQISNILANSDIWEKFGNLDFEF